MVTYFSSRTGKFKTNNINILKSLIEGATRASQACISASAHVPLDTAIVLVRAFAEKVNDKKLGSGTSEMIQSLGGSMKSLEASHTMFKMIVDKCDRNSCSERPI